jgi:hypothetical protein
MVRSIRDLRLALDSRRVRFVVCACAATAPLAIEAASNTPATCFTLNLKPNINDLLLLKLGFAMVELEGRR